MKCWSLNRQHNMPKVLLTRDLTPGNIHIAWVKSGTFSLSDSIPARSPEVLHGPETSIEPIMKENRNSTVAFLKTGFSTIFEFSFWILTDLSRISRVYDVVFVTVSLIRQHSVKRSKTVLSVRKFSKAKTD